MYCHTLLLLSTLKHYLTCFTQAHLILIQQIHQFLILILETKHSFQMQFMIDQFLQIVWFDNSFFLVILAIIHVIDLNEISCDCFHFHGHYFLLLLKSQYQLLGLHHCYAIRLSTCFQFPQLIILGLIIQWKKHLAVQFYLQLQQCIFIDSIQYFRNLLVDLSFIQNLGLFASLDWALLFFLNRWYPFITNYSLFFKYSQIIITLQLNKKSKLHLKLICLNNIRIFNSLASIIKNTVRIIYIQYNTNRIKMRSVYILVPLFMIDENLSIQEEVQKVIKMSRNQFQICQIDKDTCAVAINNFELTFSQINQYLTEKIAVERKLKLLESVLENYQHQHLQLASEGTHVEALMKKAKKYKQTKEQNKKLRKLLQIQLENTEKVRQQTQKTMKALKQQFDALVTQMNKNSDSRHSSTNSQLLHHHRQ